jgi:RNA polymerase sigma-70 factor, ECF subfamily
MPQEFSAEALLARAAEHDSGAFAELYDHFAPGLLGLAMRILNDREAAEEVMQDVFHRLWSEARRLSRERVSVGAVLFLTARARAVERLRAARKLPPLVRSQSDLKTPAWLPRPQEIALVDGRRELLKKVVSQLPKPQREALDWVVLEGMTEAEIARKLDDTPARVRAGLLAGMRFLRHRLAAVLGTWDANI